VLIVLAAVLFQVTRVKTACTDRFGYKDRFTYAADEAYRHLAIAEQIAWGSWKQTTKPTADYRSHGGVLSASASPGWTLALAGLLRVCPQADPKGTVLAGLANQVTNTGAPAARSCHLILILPLLVNLVAAGLLILLVAQRMRLDVTSASGMLACLLAVGVLMPIPLLVLTGMEHMLHALVLLAAVAVSIDVVERDRLPIGRSVLAAALLALAVSLRYESLAAVGALALWAWMRNRRSRAGLLVVSGLAVVLVVGVHLVWHGNWVLSDAMLVGLLSEPHGEWPPGPGVQAFAGWANE